MRKIFFVALLIGCLGIQNSCTLEASFEPGGYRSKLSIKAIGNNSDGSISEGGYLAVRVVGEDRDGISKIWLRIPSINVDQEFTNHSNNEHWEINQTFNIDTINFDLPKEIYVTLVDTDGFEYSRTVGLRVNE